MTVHDMVFIKEHISHMGADFCSSMTCLVPPFYRTNKNAFVHDIAAGFLNSILWCGYKKDLVVFYYVSYNFNLDMLNIKLLLVVQCILHFWFISYLMIPLVTI